VAVDPPPELLLEPLPEPLPELLPVPPPELFPVLGSVVGEEEQPASPPKANMSEDRTTATRLVLEITENAPLGTKTIGWRASGVLARSVVTRQLRLSC